MTLEPELLEAYGVTAEEDTENGEFACKIFQAYKNGTLNKAQVLEEIACKAKNKYHAAMIAMFVGYCMSETG